MILPHTMKAFPDIEMIIVQDYILSTIMDVDRALA